MKNRQISEIIHGGLSNRSPEGFSWGFHGRFTIIAESDSGGVDEWMLLKENQTGICGRVSKENILKIILKKTLEKFLK